MLFDRPKLHLARQTPNTNVNQSLDAENRMPSLTPHYNNNEYGMEPTKVIK